MERTNVAETMTNTLHDMQKKGELCDITLVVGNKTQPAHRCVLACQSNILRQTFLRVPSNNDDYPRLEIQGMCEDALTSFVNFVYTGSLGGKELPFKVVEEVVTAAQNFEIVVDKAAVVEYFQRFTRCCQFRLIVDLAEKTSMGELREFVFAFVSENLGEFMAKGHEDFCNLRLDEFTEILSRREMTETHPQVKVKAVVKWCLNEFRDQFECLDLLLGYVAIDQSTKSFLLLEMQLLRDSNDPPSRYLEVVDHLFEGDVPKYEEFQMGHSIFITGGEGNDKVPTDNMMIIHPEETGAPKTTHLPYKCVDHSVTMMDGKLYIAGGQSSNNSRMTDSTNMFYSYNPSTSKWTVLPPMQKCRSVFSLLGVDGKVYAIAGKNGMGSMASAECYDTSTNAWSYIPHTYTGIFGHAGATYDGMVFISGGVVAGRHFTYSLQCYKPKIEKWIHMTPMTHKRAFHGMCSVRGKLYVIGGNTSDDGGRRIDCDVVERYCPEGDHWRYLILMPRPVSLAGTVAFDGKIFVVGGYCGKRGEKYDEIQCLHVKRKQWSFVGSLPERLMRLAVC